MSFNCLGQYVKNNSASWQQMNEGRNKQMNTTTTTITKNIGMNGWISK